MGKSTAAAQLMRDAEIGEAFERLLWVSVGQEPDTIHLLRRLHFQMTSSHLPPNVEAELEAVQVLREASRGIKALCVAVVALEPSKAPLVFLLALALLLLLPPAPSLRLPVPQSSCAHCADQTLLAL